MLYSLTITGVDTLEELRNKYKDADFVLRNIRQCSNYNFEGDGEGEQAADESAPKIQLTSRILHGVNAVVPQNSANDNNSEDEPLQHFDHVMFHHPHLGKEDAQLHSRFLHHLFHAADRRWLKPAATNPEDNNEFEEIGKSAATESTCTQSNSHVQGGLLYLTLVNGQCSRWKCLEAAKEHGLTLIRRVPFFPPPAVSGASDKKGVNSTYYQLRRHQSGKSFAKRRRMQQQSHQHEQSSVSGCENDSEMLVFGRASDYSAIALTRTAGLLPWEQHSDPSDTKSCGAAEHEQDAFSNICPYCDKSFREERSLKNHMISTHPECKEVVAWAAEKGRNKKKRKAADLDNSVHGIEGQGPTQRSNGEMSPKSNVPGSTITCTICLESNAPTRTFSHLQALLDHQRAKHLGNHSNIKPDWYDYTSSNATNDSCSDYANEAVKEFAFGSCSICGVLYSSELKKIKHHTEFVPSTSITSIHGDFRSTKSSNSKSTIDNDLCGMPSYNCAHCSKSFRDARAQRQHENFCSIRVAQKNGG